MLSKVSRVANNKLAALRSVLNLCIGSSHCVLPDLRCVLKKERSVIPICAHT